MAKHWISCNAFTVLVETNEGDVITRAAPIVRRFEGQRLGNLLKWAASLGGFRYERLY